MCRYYLVIGFMLFSGLSQATISPRTYNALNDLQEALTVADTAEQYAEIEQDLIELRAGLKGNSLGEALTLQIIAQANDAQGFQGKAVAALKVAYALKDLDINTKGQIGTSLAYMYFTQGEFDNAILILEGHIALVKKEVSPTVFALLAMSYFSIEKFSEGLPFIEKACEIMKVPNESWLANAFAANYKLNNLAQAVFYTDQLVFNFPEKPEYWNQKVGLHQSLEDYEKAALTSNMSHRQGFLDKESQLFNLGVLMASSGAPYQVAVALDAAIINRVIDRTEKIDRLLMQAWVQSKEMDKARIALKRLFIAHKKPKDGILLVNYLMDAELWADAVSITNSLIKDKADLTEKQLGAVLLMRGVSHYRNGDSEEAIINLGKASGLETAASQAKSWMNYIKQMQG